MPRYEFLPRRPLGHRHDYARVWGKILAWWLLPAHLVWSTLVAAVYLYLHGRSFPKGQSPGYVSDGTINQSDIVTIMSTLLVISRLLITSWTPLCAWRCTFILLERTGVQLLDIKHILSTNLLLPFGKQRFSRQHFFCAFILLLTWPAQLSNPLASGSISWVQTVSSQPQNMLVPAGGWNSDSLHSYLSNIAQQYDVIKVAIGRAAKSYDAAEVANNITITPIQRISPSFQLSTGSVIQKVLAPAIFLDEAEWVDSPLPTPIEKALSDTHSGYLNATGLESPLLVGEVIGNCAILKDWPGRRNETTWNGTQYAALLVGTMQRDSDVCQMYFEDQSGKTFKYPLDDDRLGCFKVLKMKVTAGVRTCDTNSETSDSRLLCRVLSPSVATLFEHSQGSFSANLSSLSRQEISSNVFLPDVFALLPEVMQALVMMLGQFSQGAVIHKHVFQNPDIYLKDIITSSYQGIWSILQDGYSDGETDEINYFPVIDGQLKAEVAKWRVLFWWLLNALITLSGGLLFWLQSGCAQDPVTDWVTAAFRLDISSVLEKLRQNVPNESKIREFDEDTRPLTLRSLDKNSDLKHGRLKLVDNLDRTQGTGHDPGAYFHWQRQPVERNQGG